MLSAFVTIKSLDSASQTSFNLAALHLASKHPNFLGQFLLIPWGPIAPSEKGGRGRRGRERDLRVGVSLRVGPYRSRHQWGCCHVGCHPCGVAQSPKAGAFPALAPPAPSGTHPEKGRMLAGRLARLGVRVWSVGQSWSVCAGGQREERETQRCGNTGCIQRRKGGNSQW